MNVRGLAALNKNAPLTPYAFTRRELLPNDVAIEIKYAGIWELSLLTLWEQK